MLNWAYGACESLVREHGYDALTLAGIAKPAGLARAGIYNYFPGKEALLVAYTAREMEGSFSNLRAALSEVDDPLSPGWMFW